MFILHRIVPLFLASRFKVILESQNMVPAFIIVLVAEIFNSSSGMVFFMKFLKLFSDHVGINLGG